jgi:RimJ/RimL family protein N-acetyltransferase
MNKNITITGDRICLRPMAESDLPLKVQWYNDPDIRKTLILDEYLDLDKTIQWFRTNKESDSRMDFMIETEPAKPVGQISLVNIDNHHKSAEIVLVIGDKAYWGKGIMFEAEKLLIQWAFEKMDIKKIWAQTRPENIASLITMKKIGFKIEGTLRKEKMIDNQRIDVVHLGLLPEEFKPAKL